MDNNKLTQQINQFIEKTSQKKIDWKYLNANTVRFTKLIKGNRNYTVTLQMQRTKPNENYIFTIQTNNPPQVLLQLQTSISNMVAYRSRIKELFEMAMQQSQLDSVEAIDDLLKDI